jgi:hypothetical protein
LALGNLGDRGFSDVALRVVDELQEAGGVLHGP